MQEKFTFFFGGPFSQWCPSKFVVDDMEYNCAEQYMMANKAAMFNDMDMYVKIMKSNDPKDQKAYGRKVKGFDVTKWNIHAKDIVTRGNYAKFTQNDDLKLELLYTGGTYLVEASPYDTLWGIGLGASDWRAKDRKTWRGLNWLGDVLTNVRQIILVEEQ